MPKMIIDNTSDWVKAILMCNIQINRRHKAVDVAMKKFQPTNLSTLF